MSSEDLLALLLSRAEDKERSYWYESGVEVEQRAISVLIELLQDVQRSLK
jgi:hypothetical protein